MQAVTSNWRAVSAALDPRVRPSDEDLMRWYVPRPAGYDPRPALASALRDATHDTEPYRGAFAGHPGAGKTTELRLLARDLADVYFVVSLEIDRGLLGDRARPIDTLAAMLRALWVAGGTRWPEQNPFAQTNRAQELLAEARLATGIARHQSMPDPLERADWEVAEAAIDGARERLVLSGLAWLIQAARNRIGKPVLFLVDGLDDLPTSRAQDFFASPLLAELPCAVLYAAPIEVYLRREAHPSSLANWWVVSLLPTPCDSGSRSVGESSAFLQRVVRVRVSAQPLGSGTFDQPSLRRLVAMSGGVIGVLLRLCQESARLAQSLDLSEVTLKEAERAVTRARLDDTLRLRSFHRQALRVITASGELTSGVGEDVEDDLLRGNYLLSYLVPPSCARYGVAPHVERVLSESS